MASLVVILNHPTHSSFADEFRDLFGGCRIHCGWSGLFEQDFAARITRNANGQPPHESEVNVGDDIEAEGVGVEIECLILVENEEL